MFKLERALKTYREAGALNAQVNLFGFIDDHTFLTKGGDVGLILAVSGVDYECLASAEVDIYTKRLSLTEVAKTLPIGNRAELSRWRGEVKKVLAGVLA